MIALRMPSMFLPVERSITVSAPKWTAVCSFSSSPSMSLVTAELPMLALILQRGGDADRHRLEPAGGVDVVGRNDHPAGGDFVANRFGRRATSRLATNSISRRDVAGAGMLELRHRFSHRRAIL